MSTTNWLFYTNFAIFAVFLTLFITELMGGVLLLLFYDKTKAKVLPYIVPIWEVTGTFAAFWVVTADFAYPSMLIPVATIFAGYIMVFLIFLVARNASISFAEYVVRGRWLNERRLYQLYGLATLFLGLVVLVLLSSIVSGAGITLSNLSFSLAGWLTNPGSLPYVAGVLVIGVGLAPVFYGLDPLKGITVPFTVLGVALEAAALYLYSSSFLSGWFLVPAVLTVLPAVLFQSPKTAPLVTNKLIFALVGVLIVFSQSFLVYPTAFHGAIAVNAVTTGGALSTAFSELTVAGIFVVGALVGLYLYAVDQANKVRASRPLDAPTTP